MHEIENLKTVIVTLNYSNNQGPIQKNIFVEFTPDNVELVYVACNNNSTGTEPLVYLLSSDLVPFGHMITLSGSVTYVNTPMRTVFPIIGQVNRGYTFTLLDGTSFSAPVNIATQSIVISLTMTFIKYKKS